MNDWSAGYVSDIDYTYGYYRELNPAHIALAFLHAGIAFPEIGTACELGFGQGLSMNLHAAASVMQWSGTDFNPAQASFAQELAQSTDSAISVFDESFLDYSNRNDLPEFDYIGLHGIWSWVSDENRRIIVDFVRRKLKVGGVLYVSYNTLPGWATFAPMRHLLTEHASVLGSEGKGTVTRVDDALNFAQELLKTNPLYGRVNPTAGERLTKLQEQNRHYLAHEYFNKDWHPMHFATMEKWLEPAKVQFACSANYLDHIAVLNLSTEQQEFLQKITDPNFRESVRDFMTNQQFRKDYWVKGRRVLSPLDQAEKIRQLRVVLVKNRKDIELIVSGSAGAATLSEDIYVPILSKLESYNPMSLAELEAGLKDAKMNFVQLLQAIMVLMGAGHLEAVQSDDVIKRAHKQTTKLNRHLLKKARSSGDITYLASPVTGGGIAIGRFNQLFMLAIQEGRNDPAAWAQYVMEILRLQGQKLVRDGKVIESDADNLAELQRQAVEFKDQLLPMLKSLKIM